MTGGARASDVFAADLGPRPGGRLRHGLRIASAFLSQMAWGVLPSPTVHDVVVTRRDDGAEVLRVEAAGDPFQEGDVLARIRAELDRLEPEAFLAEWQANSPPRG